MNSNFKNFIVSVLIGVLLGAMGHPVYDFATQQFSRKNLLILIFAVGTAMLMTIKVEDDE